MTKTTDLVALDEWYAIAALTEVGLRPTRTRLLGQDIMYRREADGEPAVCEVRPTAARRATADPATLRMPLDVAWRAAARNL